MLPIIATIVILPFILEGYTKIGFTRPVAGRHPLFYILTPVISLLVYASLAALLGHPYIALGGWLMVYVGLTVISNVKNKVLGEPLNGPDLDTARHLFIYPEFYIAYVGATRVIFIFVLFAAALLSSLVWETSFAAKQTLMPAPAAWVLGLVAWVVVLWLLARLFAMIFSQARAKQLGFLFETTTDTARFGLFPTIVLYALMLMDRAKNTALQERRAPLEAPENAPDLIAIQGESYFNLDRLYRKLDGHADHCWSALEGLQIKGVGSGTVEVPAWGAYTMQSEFAFLSGVPNNTLGIDRINPYLRAANSEPETLATRLKAAGYRTVCIHPAKKEFFRRKTMIPKLGFDEFIGLEAFEKAEHFGLYVSDKALGDIIEQTIKNHKKSSDKPLFLFVITIESHGPWKPGRLKSWIDENKAVADDPTGDPSFALYRKHMDNVLGLFARLGPDAKSLDRPRAITMYGDHMPAFHELFKANGLEGFAVDYLLWSSEQKLAVKDDRKIDSLGDDLLRTAGFRNN